MQNKTLSFQALLEQNHSHLTSTSTDSQKKSLSSSSLTDPSQKKSSTNSSSSSVLQPYTQDLVLTSQLALDIAQALSDDFEIPFVNRPNQYSTFEIITKNIPPQNQASIQNTVFHWAGMTRITVCSGSFDPTNPNLDASKTETSLIDEFVMSLSPPYVSLSETLLSSPISYAETGFSRQGMMQSVAWITGFELESYVLSLLYLDTNSDLDPDLQSQARAQKLAFLSSLYTVDFKTKTVHLSQNAETVWNIGVNGLNTQVFAKPAISFLNSKVEPLSESISFKWTRDKTISDSRRFRVTWDASGTETYQFVTVSLPVSISSISSLSLPTGTDPSDTVSYDFDLIGIYCIDITEDLVQNVYARSVGTKTALGIPNLSVVVNLEAIIRNQS